jgi:hypothetical protein
MLSATGDYLIGQGSANFWINSPLGVAQKVETRLALWEGEWFLNNTEGTPWSQEILGYNTASLRDIAIKARILATIDVVSLESYNAVVNTSNRSLTVSGMIITSFDPNPVPFGPVALL